MTRRDEFLGTHPDFHPGMVAFSDDGQELGEVQKLDEESLTIEKGRFFSDDRRLPYDAVGDIREDHLIINRSRADLDEGTSELYGRPKEADETFVPDAQPAVPVYAERERSTPDQPLSHDPNAVSGRTVSGPERRPAPDRPSRGKAEPMPGGETFKDEEREARKDMRTTSYEDAGKIPKEDVELDRDRMRNKI